MKNKNPISINLWDIDGCIILGFEISHNETEDLEKLKT